MANQITPAIICNLIAALLRLLVLDLPMFLFLYPFRHSFTIDRRLSFRDDIYFFVIRRTNSLFSPATLRYVTELNLPDLILNSPRYKSYSHSLFQPFIHSTGSFRGHWIIQGSFTEPCEPRDSDLVIFYLHGGGYFSSSTACYLLFLLRLAETLILPLTRQDGRKEKQQQQQQQQKKVSIFALEYDLAPEHPFPTQLMQASAAYRWLTVSRADGGAGVDHRRVLLAGDSAGGHLALSLLVDLRFPYPAAEVNANAETETGSTRDVLSGTATSLSSSDSSTLSIAARPGLGVVLISPWLSLWHEPASFLRNAYTDVLSGPWLQEIAKWFIGPEWALRKVWPPRTPYLEFLVPEPKVDWMDVLPGWVWVSAGRNEVLYDDIVDWYAARKVECDNGRGVIEVDGELDFRASHVYAWLETVDEGKRRSFLARRLTVEDLGIARSAEDMHEYEAIERIGRAILKRYDRVFGA